MSLEVVLAALCGGLVVWLFFQYERTAHAAEMDLMRQKVCQEALERMAEKNASYHLRASAVLTLPSYNLLRETMGPVVADEVDQSVRLLLMQFLTLEEFNKKMDFIIRPYIDSK